jgi:hypothetical protein
MRMKGNLISLISIIFILLVGMAMTGCVTTTARTPLMQAVEKSDINTVKQLLDKGVDLNEIGYADRDITIREITINNNITMTALAFAAWKGHTNVVKLLLDKGADINAVDDHGYTPLRSAIYKGHTDIVKMLLDKGADIETGMSFRYRVGAGSPFSPSRYPIANITPLALAVLKGHANVVKILIDRGADVDIATSLLVPIAAGTDSNDTPVSARAGLKILEKYKKQEMAIQSAMPVLKPSQEVSPIVKSDVDELPAIKAKPNKNSYAIVIGIENYRQKLPKADYAVADAKTMTEYLTKVMGYPEENVVTLTNEHAAKSDFEKYFEKWLPNNVEKDSSVFIYYSGHGAPNTKTGDAYLVPYDGDPSFIEQTGYPLKKLYESLNKLQAKEIIVALDSCFSGAGGKSVIAKGARPLVMNLEHDIKLSKNMTVMSASSGDQISSTYEEKGHGLFTYFMLKGIKDGIIEIGELFDYLKPHVGRTARKVYNNEQTPQLIAPEKKKVFLRN